MAFRFLSHDRNAVMADGMVDDKDKIPFFDELVRGVIFSRWLMKTYVALSVCLLVSATVVYRARLAIASWRRRARHRRSASKGGGERCRGSRDAHGDETKPLLGRRLGERYRYRGRFLSRLTARVRGVLNYQPPDVWVYESPPVSTCLILGLYFALNGFYMFYRVPLESLKAFIFADRLGGVFVMNLPLLYLTAAKNPLIKILTGWPYERLNILHRAVGRLCITAAIGHFAGSYWVWRTILAHLMTFPEYLAHPVIAFGLVAWSSYMLLGLTSKEEFRTAFYEAFLLLHVLLQALSLGFLYFHHSTTRPYVLASILIFTLDRILYRLLYASVRMRGTLTLFPDRETVKITLSPPEDYYWPVAGHVFLSIPEIARFHHPHPFSILTPPPPWGNRMEFLIRARDGFSKRLMQEALEEGREVEAVVDGPYGCGRAFECLDSAEVAVAVAGGSGIAVVYPLIHAVAIEDHPNHSGDGLSIGDDDDGEEQAAAERERERERKNKKIVLLWIVRGEDNSKNWLPAEAVNELRMAGVEVLVHVTQKKRYRPDLRTMLGLAMVAEERMGVVVCGPNGMVRDVRNACAEMQRHGKIVDVVTEKFGW